MDWLRLISTALALGHKPGTLLALGVDEVAELVDAPKVPSTSEAVEAILGATRAFDSVSLRLSLQRHWTDLGARAFLLQIVVPTLAHVGEAWSKGLLEIRHEHFLSGVLEDELRSLRTSLREPDHGPLVLFATFAEERHSLGLQLAAFVGVLAGARVKVLGTGMPVEQLAAAADETRATALAISVSLASGGVETDRKLAQLRREVPDEARLIVGGRGARGAGRRGPRGIEYIESLEQFEEWIAQLDRETRARF